MSAAPPRWGWTLPAAAVTAALLAVTVPPVGAWPAHAVAHVPLLLALRGASTRRALLAGGIAGLLLNLAVFGWALIPLQAMIGLDRGAAVVVLIGFAALMALPTVAICGAVPALRERHPDHWPVAWALWGVVVEGIAQHTLPVPVAQGVSLLAWLPVAQLASVTGVVGLTGLLLVTNGALAHLLTPGLSREARLTPVVGAALLVSLCFGAGQARMHAVEAQLAAGPKLRLMQLQTAHGVAWRQSQSAGELLAWWTDLTLRVQEPVDLVVWPESAIANDVNRPAFVAQMRALAASLQADLIVGSGAQGTRREPFNAVFHFGADPTLAAEIPVPRIVERLSKDPAFADPNPRTS